ncbi:MAG TPA: methyltransferase [Gemmatimonadaceae bacterium]
MTRAVQSSVHLPQGLPAGIGVPSLLDEAWRLVPFTPPFAFSAFFSPEDTLLCVCASDAALDLVHRIAVDDGRAKNGIRVAELTSGSGLIGLYLLGRDPEATLLGLDIDDEAAEVAKRNALKLGMSDRTQFARADLWSPKTFKLLEAGRPNLMVCNPPYVPEPPGTRMQLEAAAGPHGTAHIMRALEVTRLIQPDALSLSWCSLTHPGGVVATAHDSGYEIETLYVTAIADGEYSGSVHDYLRSLSDCFINEQPDTLAIVAPDHSARFAFLLFAGSFRRRDPAATDSTHDVGDTPDQAAEAVQKICEDFVREGVKTLASAHAPFSVHCSILSRWDELALRVMLHGTPSPRASSAR